MKTRLSFIVYRLSFAVLAAILSVLAFPNFNINLLAWIGLVPLLFAIDAQKPLRSILLSYVAGVFFFFGAIYWLIHVTLPGTLVVVLYLALYFGLFGFLASFFLRKTINDKRTTDLILPLLLAAAWVLCEWLRSNLFTGFGWALLGHSQAGNTVIIQIADITGAYGVSFLIVFVNTSIFLTIKGMRENDHKVHYLVAALTLVFLADVYGIVKTKTACAGGRLRVAVVQGNIPQSEKWDSRFRRGILDKYERLTDLAAKARPELVIWPETSVPAFIEFDKGVAGRLGAIAGRIGAPLLVGAPSEDAGGAIYNSAVLFGKDGKVTGRYDKLHLVPFGEYVPFKRALSFVERFAPSPIGDFSPGRDLRVFSFFIDRRSDSADARVRLVRKVRFSCIICFEDIFPDIARAFVKHGADFLVNITNDAWFRQTSAPYQHAQSSVFRAVENRVNVIRAANTGFSCFINPSGEVTAAVESHGRRLFVDGVASADIVLSRTPTAYTLYGDVFAYACMAFLASCALVRPGKV